MIRLFGRIVVLRLLAAAEAGVTTRELAVESFDTSSSINVLQTSGIERVASRANIDFHFRLSAAGYERISATASYLHFDVTGMNSFFHLSDSIDFSGVRSGAIRRRLCQTNGLVSQFPIGYKINFAYYIVFSDFVKRAEGISN